MRTFHSSAQERGYLDVEMDRADVFNHKGRRGNYHQKKEKRNKREKKKEKKWEGKQDHHFGDSGMQQ